MKGINITEQIILLKLHQYYWLIYRLAFKDSLLMYLYIDHFDFLNS